MEVRFSSLKQGAESARGAAVVIDVYRAFTTAPLLFEAGVSEIVLVAEPEEGLALKQKNPDLILVGEVGGVPIDGFDLGNSPSQVLSQDAAFFRGRRAALRTSSGVQGALLALQNARQVLLAGFVTARAVADYLKGQGAELVSIVAMGQSMLSKAPEDELCGQYIGSLLGACPYDHRQAMRELLASSTTRQFMDQDKPWFPPQDPIICLQRDLYGQVIEAREEDGQVVARPLA